MLYESVSSSELVVMTNGSVRICRSKAAVVSAMRNREVKFDFVGGHAPTGFASRGVAAPESGCI